MKKTVQTDYRVEASAMSMRRPDDYDGQMRAARKLARQIQRHCDTQTVIVTYESKTVCGFCGYEWDMEWDTSPKGPTCCDRAVAEFEAGKANPATDGQI